jgi:hypothetical protein
MIVPRILLSSLQAGSVPRSRQTFKFLRFSPHHKWVLVRCVGRFHDLVQHSESLGIANC